MRVMIISGFLGSGKTTSVLKIAKMLTDAGKKVAIIVNEVGEIGIDGETLDIAGIPSKQITNGCICCSLKLSLSLTISELSDTYNPDVLILEPTGLSFPQQIRDELCELNVMMTFSPITALVDTSRFSTEISQIPKFITQQLIEAEIIGLNKMDLADASKVAEVESFLKEINPNALLVYMSAATDESSVARLYDLLMSADHEKCSSDYEKSETTLNSVEISNVSTYSGLYDFSGKVLSKEDAGKMLEHIISSAGMDLSKINYYFVGHVKMAVKIGDTLVKVSQVSASDDRKIEAEYIVQEPEDNNGKYELRFLSAVTNIPKDRLTVIIDQSIQVFLKAKGLEFEKRKSAEGKKNLIEL
ncbi:GTP-binding protein [Methanolapillus millepedarum]|uniref:CobW/HypB/UreG nucleotide-binding domain-containing protein n=1 Tax=Methanolapillus millepedarum TaxID=3028296 RepID=A0AA96ZWB0_9EURY|nr:hypothetical protein MsAc7_13070 [Methanosarcinaceae archaeon Ac7]